MTALRNLGRRPLESRDPERKNERRLADRLRKAEGTGTLTQRELQELKNMWTGGGVSQPTASSGGSHPADNNEQLHARPRKRPESSGGSHPADNEEQLDAPPPAVPRIGRLRSKTTIAQHDVPELTIAQPSATNLPQPARSEAVSLADVTSRKRAASSDVGGGHAAKKLDRCRERANATASEVSGKRKSCGDQHPAESKPLATRRTQGSPGAIAGHPDSCQAYINSLPQLDAAILQQVRDLGHYP